MSYLVINDLGNSFYLAQRSHGRLGKEFVVFRCGGEIFVGVESYVYDEVSNKLLWEGIQDLGLVIVGFADTEEAALDLAF